MSRVGSRVDRKAAWVTGSQSVKGLAEKFKES